MMVFEHTIVACEDRNVISTPTPHQQAETVALHHKERRLNLVISYYWGNAPLKNKRLAIYKLFLLTSSKIDPLGQQYMTTCAYDVPTRIRKQWALPISKPFSAQSTSIKVITRSVGHLLYGPLFDARDFEEDPWRSYAARLV
jgi:hypothetical protein